MIGEKFFVWIEVGWILFYVIKDFVLIGCWDGCFDYLVLLDLQVDLGGVVYFGFYCEVFFDCCGVVFLVGWLRDVFKVFFVIWCMIGNDD